MLLKKKENCETVTWTFFFFTAGGLKAVLTAGPFFFFFYFCCSFCQSYHPSMKSFQYTASWFEKQAQLLLKRPLLWLLLWLLPSSRLALAQTVHYAQGPILISDDNFLWFWCLNGLKVAYVSVGCQCAASKIKCLMCKVKFCTCLLYLYIVSYVFARQKYLEAIWCCMMH